ncbi:unnamed protein product, partial [Rotaria socialis]
SRGTFSLIKNGFPIRGEIGGDTGVGWGGLKSLATWNCLKFGLISSELVWFYCTISGKTVSCVEFGCGWRFATSWDNSSIGV